MEFTDADLAAEALRQAGRAPEEIDSTMEVMGYGATDLAAPDSTVTDTSAHAATAGLTFESKGLIEYLQNDGMKMDDGVAIDALKHGLDAGSYLKPINKGVRKWASTVASDTVRRGGNVLEMALGAAYPFWNGGQQSFFGWIRGDKPIEIAQHLIGEPTEPGSQESTPFMSSIEQLGKLASASLHGDFARAAILADTEPRVFENMNNDINLEKMIVGKAFGGDQDAYDRWLMQLNQSNAGKVGMFALSVADPYVSAFADPLAVTGEVRMAVKGPLEVLKFVPKVSGAAGEATKAVRGFRTLEEAKGLKLQADIQKVLDPAQRTIGDAYDVHRRAEKMLETAKKAYEANPQDVETARKYALAVKRMSEAEDSMTKFMQNDLEDIYVPKAPKQDPNKLGPKIQTKGRTVENIRRNMLAAEHASPKEIKRALAEQGLGSEANVREMMNKSIKAIRDGKALESVFRKGAGVDYDVLNGWERLPSNVKRALAIKGINMPEVRRIAALHGRPLDPQEWMKLDELPLFATSEGEKAARGTASQRLLLGPDDVEVAGDAAKILTEGGELTDVTMHGTVYPEYSHVGNNLQKPRGIFDGHWTKEVIDSRKVEQADGSLAFSDKNQQLLFDLHSAPGLVGHTPKPLQFLQRKLFPMREPRYALKGTGVFERMRSGLMNYEIAKGGSDEFLERVLHEAGVVKKGVRTGFRVAYDGEHGAKSARNISRMLDLEVGSEDYVKHYDNLTEKERTAFLEIRKWFDNLADRQGINTMNAHGKRGPRVSGYWRHVFPESMFEGGARPPEFMGLPVTAEVNGSHLMPRLGKQGYSMDLLEVLENYNRAAHRKIYTESTMQDMLDLAESTQRPEIVSYTQDLVREMKGTPTAVDQHIDSWLKAQGFDLPPASQMGAAVSSMFYSSMIGGNVNYLIQNLGTGVLNPMSRFGIMNTARGVLQMATPEGRELAKKSGVGNALSKLFEDAPLREYSDFMTALGPKQSEFYVRGLSFHAALSDIVRKSGKSLAEMTADGTIRAALAEAVNASEQVQHIYGVAGRSPMVTQRIGRGAQSFLGQFMSFPLKQSEMLMSMGGEDYGHVLRYFGYSGIAQRFAAQELNIDATQWTGLGYLPMQLNGEEAPLSPGLSSIMAFVAMSEAARRGDPSEIEKTQKDWYDAWTSLIPGFAPMRKLGESMDRLKEGAVTVDNKFIRPVELPAEILPTLLQTPSMTEHTYRNVEQQHRQQVQNEHFFGKKLTDAYVEAIRTGDIAKYTDLQEKLFEMGIYVSPNGNAIEPLFMSRQLQWYMDNPQFMPPGFVPNEEQIRESQ